MLQNVFSFSRTLRVLCDFCVSNAYTWTIYFYSWVLYVQLRFQLSSHSFHPQYLWQFSKQLADSYLVFFMLPVITPGYPLTWSAGGSGMSNSVTPWTGARQAPLSVGFSGQNTGVGIRSLLQGISIRDRTQVSHIAGRLFTIWAMSMP